MEEEKDLYDAYEELHSELKENKLPTISEDDIDLEKEFKKYDASFKSLVQKKIESPDGEINFDIPDLKDIPNIDNYLKPDEKVLYTIGREISLDKDKKIDLLSFIPEKFIEEETLKNLKDNPTDSEEYKNALEFLREETIFKAYTLYIGIEQQRYNDSIVDILQRSYPEEIAKAYFDKNNKLYGFNEDTQEVNYYKNEDNKPKNELLFSQLDDVRDIYKLSLTLENFIKIAKDEKFENKLMKNCKAVRYKRCKDRCNTMVTYYKKQTSKSEMNSVDSIPTFINRLITDNNSFLKEFNKKTKLNVLNKSLIVAMYTLFNDIDVKSTRMLEPMLVINHIFMLNMNGTKDLSGSRKILFNALKEFILIVYKEQRKRLKQKENTYD